MIASELISQHKIRERIFDTLNVTYTDGELIAYINDGINIVWNKLGYLGYYEVIGDIVFTTASEQLPNNFAKFTSKVPIIIKSDGSAEVYGSLPQVTRYIKKPQFINDMANDMPFKNDAINNLIAQIVIMFALNRNEYSVEFEKNMINELQQAII